MEMLSLQLTVFCNRTDYLYKMNLALNNLQRFICHKTQTINHQTFNFFFFFFFFFFFQTQLNICVIFLTEIIWEKFRSNTGMCEPYVVSFPDYTKGAYVYLFSFNFFFFFLSLILKGSENLAKYTYYVCNKVWRGNLLCNVKKKYAEMNYLLCHLGL